MGCDLCGKEGMLFQVRIEGTVMTVCEGCKSYGEVIKRLPTVKESKLQEKQQKTGERGGAVSGASTAPQETLILVRVDYAKRIKDARERLGLKQEELAKLLRIKESMLHKYETGSAKPDLETAHTLEKTLRIKLVEEYTEEHAGARAKASGPLTIGDMVKVRKR
jgi:putative transcription factor